MGLDSYLYPKRAQRADLPRDLILCDWDDATTADAEMVSFRGKVYDSLFERIVGDTLYAESASAEWVAMAAGKLDAFCLWNADLPDHGYPAIGPVMVDKQFVNQRPMREIRSLSALFRWAADHGATYCGSW
jgi:hypothetical protein